MIEWHLYPDEAEPSYMGEFLVTYYNEYNNKKVTSAKYGWFGFEIKGVVAWAEMPDPYEGKPEREEVKKEWWEEDQDNV